MEIPSHPTVDEPRQAVQGRGGKRACATCGHEEFALDEVAIMVAGKHEDYGAHRLRRAQLVCENCGCVTAFDPERLRSGT